MHVTRFRIRFMVRAVGIAVLNALTLPVPLASAQTTYVSPSGSHQHPFASWVTAATNIQAAVDACPQGGQVLVTNGTYRLTSAVVLTNAVTVRSSDASAPARITGAGISPCFLVAHANATVDGFILDGGRDAHGGGAQIESGCGRNLTVSNCVATLYGGGVFLGSKGRLEDSSVIDNEALYGGGVYCQTGGELSNCRVCGNRATDRGGGVALIYGGTVHDCTISSNEASLYGGGIHIASAGSVTKSTVAGNRANQRGGGLYLEGGGVLVESVVADNRSNGFGGGAFLENGGTCRRVTCTGNRASSYGGGVLVQISGRIENALITGNSADDRGGGVVLWQGGQLMNSTVAGNTSGTYGNGLFCNLGGSVTNSIIYANTGFSIYNCENFGSGMTYGYCLTTPAVTGTNIFTNAPGFRNVAAGDYRLRWGGFAVDRGTSDDAPTVDYRGRLRPKDGDTNGTALVDIGAYEYDPSLDDSDSDRLSDLEELLSYATDPLDPDSDNDRSLDGDEIIAGTDPRRAGSVLAVTGAEPLRALGTVVIEWLSVTGRLYNVQTASTVDAPWTVAPGGADRAGTGEMLRYTNTVPAASRGYFRVRVRRP